MQVRETDEMDGGRRIERPRKGRGEAQRDRQLIVMGFVIPIRILEAGGLGNGQARLQNRVQRVTRKTIEPAEAPDSPL